MDEGESPAGNAFDDVLEEIDDQTRRVRILSRAHYLASKYCTTMSYRLGVPAIGLSTAVGAGILTAPGFLAGNTREVLLSEAHRVAGARYSRFLEKLRVLRLRATTDEVERSAVVLELGALLDAMAELQEQVPDLSDRVYGRAKAEAGATARHPAGAS